MFKNIMIAIDGSRYTESVITYAVSLARIYSGQIYALTIADVRIFEWASAMGADGFVTIVPSGAYQEESVKILEEKCDKILQKCGALLYKEQVRYKTEKMVGSPVEIILSKSQVADLVIMGKRGEFERWDNHELGVTVQMVCRNITKPLLVVKKEFRLVKKILLGYDGSVHANKALQYSANLAERSQAAISVVCVTDDKDFGQFCCQEATDYLEAYTSEVQSEVIAGTPDRELVSYAQANHMDLIAIGAFGRSRIREAILGSTTEHILRFSTCPILLAK